MKAGLCNFNSEGGLIVKVIRWLNGCGGSVHVELSKPEVELIQEGLVEAAYVDRTGSLAKKVYDQEQLTMADKFDRIAMNIDRPEFQV